MKRDVIIAVVAVLLVSAMAYGLSSVSRDLPVTPSEPFKEKATSRKPGKNEKVVMRINGEPITETELNALLQAAPAEAKGYYGTPAGRRALADELVKVKALEQEGKRLGLDADPAVQTQVDMMRTQITAGRALEKLVEMRSEEKIRAAYESQKKNSISLRHIALSYAGGQIPPRDPNAVLTPEQAMARAREVAKQIRGGVDFAAMAAALSDDMQSAQKGGLLGPVQPQTLPPDIAAVVSKLQPGQISEPVKTEFAVHLFKVEHPTLEDLRPMLSQQVRQQAAEEEITRLQKAAKVELDPKYFPPEPRQNPRPMPTPLPKSNQ